MFLNDKDLLKDKINQQEAVQYRSFIRIQTNSVNIGQYHKTTSDDNVGKQNYQELNSHQVNNHQNAMDFKSATTPKFQTRELMHFGGNINLSDLENHQHF